MKKNLDHTHPYIPNSAPKVRLEMIREIGVENIQDLLKAIPKRLRLNRSLNLPDPLLSEYDIKKHVSEILSKNKPCNEYLNFIGAGCWQHYVPAVVDEITHRSEFVTAYAGNTYSDLGKWQSFFEFQSMMGELLEMDAVSLPTFDWGTAASFAIRIPVVPSTKYASLPWASPPMAKNMERIKLTFISSIFRLFMV